MRLRSARVVVVLLGAALVAVAAGCGGGGSKSPASTQAHTSAATTSPAKKTSGNSGSVPNFASAKNCQDLANLAAKAASAITATSGNPATTLQTEATQLQALANAAPSDIRADFQTVAAAFSSFLHSLEKAGYKPGAAASTPTAKQIAALTKAAQTFNTPKVAKAEQHLNAWIKQNCKGVKVGG
jgi:hypothetical protein